MKTVEDIITAVYGTRAAACAAFKVGNSAISNWVAWGHFPTRLLAQIITDAMAKGVAIGISDIPLPQAKGVAA